MWFYRRAYNKSKKIFTVSEFSKSRINFNLGNNKPVIVTYSAAQPAFYTYRTNKSNCNKTKTIVFIGNIKKHKGLDCLIDAFLMAKKENLPHKLLIIGERNNFRTKDNAILHKIDNSASDTVEFTGFITDEKLMEYLSSASLLVQPSLYEGFCLPPLEALILGTPVLISDIPVLKEIYSEFPVTFFRAGDISDLKNKILELLSDKIPSITLSDNLLSKYSFEKTASVILKELTS